MDIETHELIEVYNENDGPAARTMYGPDGHVWHRRTTTRSVPEGYEPAVGDWILVPLTMELVPQLAVNIGEELWEKSGEDELDEYYGLTATIAAVAHGLAREIEVYHAGF